MHNDKLVSLLCRLRSCLHSSNRTPDHLRFSFHQRLFSDPQDRVLLINPYKRFFGQTKLPSIHLALLWFPQNMTTRTQNDPPISTRLDFHTILSTYPSPFFSSCHPCCHPPRVSVLILLSEEPPYQDFLTVAATLFQHSFLNRGVR